MTNKDLNFLDQSGFINGKTYLYSQDSSLNFLQNERLMNIFNASYGELTKKIDYAYIVVDSSGEESWISYNAEVYVKLIDNDRIYKFLMSSENLLETIEQALLLSYHELE